MVKNMWVGNFLRQKGLKMVILYTEHMVMKTMTTLLAKVEVRTFQRYCFYHLLSILEETPIFISESGIGK